MDTYPYTANNRLNAIQLNHDFELSAGVVPPNGAGGGAGQFKLWMDTSVNPQPALRIVTAARATAGVYVPSEWATMGRLDLATRKFQYEGTWGGPLFVSGEVHAAGDIYSASNLYLAGQMIFFNGNTNSALGPRLFVDNNSFVMHLGPGNVSFSVLNSAAALIAYIDGFGNFSGTNLTLSQPYIHFMGSTGGVSTTGGPLIYADNNNHVYKLGSGNGAWIFQNYAGANSAVLGADGSLSLSSTLHVPDLTVTSTITAGVVNSGQYFLSNRALVTGDGTTTFIYDPSGGIAFHLQANTNHYDADLHLFRNNAAVERARIDGGGSFTAVAEIVATGNLHAGQGLFLGNPFILFNGNTNLSQGPYISADNSTFTARLGVGNVGFYFQNVAATNLLQISNGGDLTLAGATIHFGNSGGALGGAGGPLMYGDANYLGFKPGSGNLGWLWWDYNGNEIAKLLTSGNFNIKGTLFCNDRPFLRADTHDTGGFNSIYDNTGIESIQLGNPGAFINYHSQSSHVFRERLSIAATNYVLFNASGTYNASGAWGLISDAETKDDITLYDRGLDAILALKPVSYRYKPGTPFADPDRTLRYGLVAQEVEPLIPEMIGEASFRVGEADVSHKTMSPGHLVYVLVNAVRQLAARVEALEHSS